MNVPGVASWFVQGLGFVLAAVVMGGHAEAVPAHDREARTLTVSVRDGQSAEPVDGARVSIPGTDRHVVTDGDGVARVVSNVAGPVAVRVVADGYRSEEVVVGTGTDGVTVVLAPAVLRLDQSIIVVAGRTDRVDADVPRATGVIGRTTIDERAARTTPSLLLDQGGWVQHTNHGGGSPFLRGLVGNQVLVLIDGIRLNNATFRLGPNQYMNTVDSFVLDRVEVLRGSGSVAYGSDAMGGVINLVTPRPLLSPAGLTGGGAVSSRFASGGMEASGRIDGFVSGRRVAARGGVTYRRFGDLVAGGSLGAEAPSAYDEADVDTSLLWAPAEQTRVTAVFQQVHQFDVPRYDQVAQRGYAVYSFDPQIRRLGYVELHQRVGLGWLDSARVTASWHRSEEGRLRRKTGSVVETREADVVTTAGLSLDLHGRLTPWLAWNGGADVYDDVVRSWRRDRHTSSGASSAMRGLYPDGATRRSVAAFLMASAEVGRVSVEAGSRLTRDDVRARDLAFGHTAITPDAIVTSVAVAYLVRPGVRAFASAAQAFRAPNIDDLSTLGLFDFGIEVPPETLEPERALSYEAGFKLTTARVSGGAAVFRSNLQNLIDRERTTFQGAPTLDGHDVYRRANLGEAYIRGVEADVEWRLASGTALFGFGSTTYGRQRAADIPLRRIPPTNGQVGVRQSWAGGRWLEAAVRAARTQDRLAPGDLSDHRIPAGGTPGWVTLNLAAGMRIGGSWSLTGGLANVFNEAYRIHGSGVDAPGRHAWLSATVRY